MFTALIPWLTDWLTAVTRAQCATINNWRRRRDLDAAPPTSTQQPMIREHVTRHATPSVSSRLAGSDLWLCQPAGHPSDGLPGTGTHHQRRPPSRQKSPVLKRPTGNGENAVKRRHPVGATPSGDIDVSEARSGDVRLTGNELSSTSTWRRADSKMNDMFPLPLVFPTKTVQF